MRAFPFDYSVLVSVTVLIFLLAWSGVSITMANVVYCWMLSIAFTRCVIAGYDLGSEHQEKELLSAISLAKNLGDHHATKNDVIEKRPSNKNMVMCVDTHHGTNNEIIANINKNRQTGWNPTHDFG